jgi:cell division septation protein DedD
MSKIYEALQRLEWERAAYHAGKQGTPAAGARRSGAWWTGALVGCMVGFVMGIVAVIATPARWRALAPPETTAVADVLPPAVAHASAPTDAPVAPPVAAPTPPPAAVAAPPPAAAPTADVPSPPTAAVEPQPVIPEPEAALDPASYTIQVGTFRDPANAARLAARLEASAHRVKVERSGSADGLWVVRIEGYADRSEAEAVRAGLEREGLAGLLVSNRSARESEDALRHSRAPVGD